MAAQAMKPRRPPLCIGWPSKSKSCRIARYFSAGCGHRYTDKLEWDGKTPVAMYGVKSEGYELFDRVRVACDWYYIDNAYFGRGTNYRVVRNGFQYRGPLCPDYGRWQRHGVVINPWRRSGGHILVCLQTESFYRVHSVTTSQAWLNDVMDTLRQHTDRQIIVREKGSQIALGEHLKDCHAIVTLSSNCAIDALCAGVPAFVTGDSAAIPLARTDLAMIESPLRHGEREPLMATLASQQWTLDEFRTGRAWRDLCRQ